MRCVYGRFTIAGVGTLFHPTSLSSHCFYCACCWGSLFWHFQNEPLYIFYWPSVLIFFSLFRCCMPRSCCVNRFCFFSDPAGWLVFAWIAKSFHRSAFGARFPVYSIQQCVCEYEKEPNRINEEEKGRGAFLLSALYDSSVSTAQICNGYNLRVIFFSATIIPHIFLFSHFHCRPLLQLTIWFQA